MNWKILLVIVAGAVILALSLNTLVRAIIPLPCVPVQVLAVGGCDSDGLCGSVVVNQDGAVSKILLSHPVAGFPECTSP
jgi:hypothetical protein